MVHVRLSQSFHRARLIYGVVEEDGEVLFTVALI